MTKKNRRVATKSPFSIVIMKRKEDVESVNGLGKGTNFAPFLFQQFLFFYKITFFKGYKGAHLKQFKTHSSGEIECQEISPGPFAAAMDFPLKTPDVLLYQKQCGRFYPA